MNHHGKWRSVAVGRCKVESRPVVKVTYTWKGKKEGGGGNAQVFVQQAETVRFCMPPPTSSSSSSSSSAPAPQSKSVTEMKAGDRVLVRARNRGTHLGRPIAAKVSER